MERISIKLDAFEGPLDLLIHLIEKSKIDIYDIPIAALTDQYMMYLEDFNHRDMEAISEFLVMASTLLEIKSKMLLPVVQKNMEEEIDPREDLVNKLIEYKKFKQVIGTFKTQESIGERFFYKKPDEHMIRALKMQAPVSLEDVLQGITLEMLYKVFDETLQRRELKTDKIRSGFNAIQKDLFSLEEKMEYIVNLLFLEKRLIFSDIFIACGSKSEKVVTFLALLELMKMKKVTIKQDSIFAEIMVYQL